MKKIILVIVATIFFASNNNAQENVSNSSGTDSREKIHLGLKVGANYANVYDDDEQEFNADPKFGLAAGVYLAIPIGKFLGVQPEVLFSQKGFKATNTILGYSYDVTRTTSYIDVPILFAFKPAEVLTILAGPEFSFLVKQKDEFGNTTEEQNFDNDNLRDNTFGFLGGIDLNLDNFAIGARVGWDIQTNNGDGTSTIPRYKNIWYQVTLGFRIL